MAHGPEQIARKPVAHGGGGARRPAQIRIQAVVALFFKDERKNLLLEIALDIEVTLRIVFLHPRIHGAEICVQLHHRIPLGAP